MSNQFKQAMDEPSKKRRKGGQQRRIAAAQAEQDTTDPAKIASNKPSLLGQYLQEQWAWGRFSPQEVQHISSLAKKDMEAAGVRNPQMMLQSLASMGSDGQHANNVHRDLMALIKDKTELPQPLHVQMPLKTKAKVALQAIMLPHLVFHSLWVHYKDYWARCFLPNGTDGLLHFWNHFETHPSMAGHCLCSKPNWKNQVYH